MLPKDKQLFAAQLRRRQLQRQLPLHDLHSKFCDSVTEKEMQKFHKFAEKRKNKAAGIGSVGSVPDNGIRVCIFFHFIQALTHLYKMDTGKQCRPKSDAAERSSSNNNNNNSIK